MPLPPVPPDMGAEVRHDGVCWDLYEAPDAGAFAMMVVPAVVWGLATFTAGVPWLAALGLLPLAVAALLLLQHAWRVRVQITDRAVLITRWRGLGRQDLRLELDALAVARVSPPRREGGTGSAVLRAGETVVSVGAGRPPHHLEWLVAAVDEARRAMRQRERVEGREYGFMKKAPAEVTALRES